MFHRRLPILGMNPSREIMQPQQHGELRDVIVLPLLLIIAFAAWTATFLGGTTARR